MLTVKSGWQRMHEVNRVVFDPQRITVEQIIGRLQQEGTYIKTLGTPPPLRSGTEGANRL
ncbi:MAG: hypothetical protein KJ950_15800 [Proteobacteria bacterium]|nr:hypothetical protein [Pseudomonadota bacterium]MBU1688809.1 hypothetical protein [Pseudomonadota bacterium]